MESEPPRIEFPCAYPIKVLARSSEDLTEVILTVFEQHAPGFDRTAVTARVSGKGTFTALTVTITTLVVLIGGSTALGPISRRWSNVRNWAPTAGLAVGAVTMVMPFFAADDAKTGATLAAMHLITGLAWFGALRPSKAE